MSGGETLTLTPRGNTQHVAWVRFAPEQTTARLSRGRTWTLRHGEQVDGLRLSSSEGVSSLDLMRGERCVARIRSDVWELDGRLDARAALAARAAEVTGLPLARPAAVSEPAPLLRPGGSPTWLVPLVLVMILAPLLLLVLALVDGPVVVALAIQGLALTGLLARLALDHGGRPTRLWSARPRGTVARSMTRAGLVGRDGERWLTTYRSVRPLPPPGDLLAPASLHRVRVGRDREPRRRLEVRAADGFVLASLDPRSWTGEGGVDELAATLGATGPGAEEQVDHSPQGIEPVGPVRDIRLLVNTVAGAIVAAGWARLQDGPVADATVALGVLTIALALLDVGVGAWRRRAAARPTTVPDARVAP